MAENSEEVREEQGSSRDSSHPLSTTPDTSPLGVSSFTHTPFYCEENVYLLCKKLSMIWLADPKGLDLFVLFISNETKKVPLWHQKASKRIDGLVIWDYHVICIQSQRNGEGNARHLVWDLDSRLPFPFPLSHYFTETFQPMLSLSFTYSRLFRVVHAPMFIRCFASDRSHMKDPLGNWVSMPPTYERIVAEDGTVNNLDEYVRMSAADSMTDAEALTDGVYSNKFGVVISESRLESFFSQIHLFARATDQKHEANGSILT